MVRSLIALEFKKINSVILKKKKTFIAGKDKEIFHLNFYFLLECANVILRKRKN